MTSLFEILKIKALCVSNADMTEIIHFVTSCRFTMQTSVKCRLPQPTDKTSGARYDVELCFGKILCTPLSILVKMIDLLCRSVSEDGK